MKQQEAEILAGAGAIEIATIMRRDDGWTVHLYGQDHSSIARDCDAVEVARGHRVLRVWASLDNAHKWIRALPGGRGIKIGIDG